LKQKHHQWYQNKHFSGKEMLYPIRIENRNRAQIERAVQVVNENVKSAKSQWRDIRNNIIRSTQTKSYMHFDSELLLFTPLEKQNQHMLEAVLVVSERFQRRPEVVLTLWQMEGLPSYLHVEGSKNGYWSNLRDFTKDYTSQDPRDEDEARSWSRSVILFQRWGLDLLIPKKSGTNTTENVPLYSSPKKTHDDVFQRGYEKEMKSTLPESPLTYFLINDSTKAPIEIKKAGQLWQFRTKSEYQSTVLAMQQAVFKYREAKIPSEINGVSLQPPFPALVYIYYNSKFPNESVKKMIHILKSYKDKYKTNTVEELYRAYTSEKIHKEVEHHLLNRCGVDKEGKKVFNCHGYMNGLRFEFLRRVYSVVFNGVDL